METVRLLEGGGFNNILAINDSVILISAGQLCNAGVRNGTVFPAPHTPTLSFPPEIKVAV